MVKDDGSSAIPLPAMELALRFFRDPAALRAWGMMSATLPEGAGEVIRLAGAKEESLCAAAEVYQSDAVEIGEAARFFLQQVLLEPGADHYRVLGVSPDADNEQVRRQHRLLMRLFHPDRHAGKECWTDSYATRVNEAYNVLRRPEARKRYHETWVGAAATHHSAAAVGRPIPTGANLPTDPAPAAYLRSTPRPRSPSSEPWVHRNRKGLIAAVTVLLIVLLLTLNSIREDDVFSVEPVGTGGGREVNRQPVAGPRAGLPQAPGEDGTGASTVVDVDDRDFPLAIQDDDISPIEGALPRPLMDEPNEVPLTVIPKPRDAGMGVDEYPHTPLVIPPSRRVDVPPPKSAMARADGDTKRSSSPVGAGERAGSGPPAAHGTHAPTTPDAVTEHLDLALTHREAAADVFSEPALMALLGHLVGSYQQGDLAAFIGLFSASASTSDEATRHEIEREYRSLFSSTQMRSLQVSGLNWRSDPGGARGEGFMVLQLWRTGGSNVERYEGRFSVDITHEQRQLMIAGLFYDLERM